MGARNGHASWNSCPCVVPFHTDPGFGHVTFFGECDSIRVLLRTCLLRHSLLWSSWSLETPQKRSRYPAGETMWGAGPTPLPSLAGPAIPAEVLIMRVKILWTFQPQQKLCKTEELPSLLTEITRYMRRCCFKPPSFMVVCYAATGN